MNIHKFKKKERIHFLDDTSGWKITLVKPIPKLESSMIDGGKSIFPSQLRELQGMGTQYVKGSGKPLYTLKRVTEVYVSDACLTSRHAIIYEKEKLVAWYFIDVSRSTEFKPSKAWITEIPFVNRSYMRNSK